MTVITIPRRIRVVAILSLVALFAISCSDDAGGDAEPVGTDAPVESPSTSSTLPPTTAPIPETGVALADLELTFVDFSGDGYVEFVNNGDEAVDLAGLQICKFPDYRDLGTVVASGSIAPGETVRVDGAELAGLDASGGEVGLYLEADFGSAEAIISYVQWGVGGGTRAPVATEAEIWPSADTFVTVDPEFNSIESGGDAADPELWG